MALDLHIAGPGLDVTRRIASGEPALVLGRDTDCAVCLPDPQRNISRRHLSVWNEGEQLHFHVLSVVNGVDTNAGELPPGARGVLAPGDMLALSAYRLTFSVVPSAQAGAGASDPWAEFEKQAAQLVPAAGLATIPGAPDDDPFGDWGFQSTFGPGAPRGGLSADALAPATDLGPFFAGLGLARPGRHALTQGELETIGRLTRIALQGLLDAVESAAASRKEVRADDRTLAERREMNPLRLDTSIETKLDYLFGGQAAAAGFLAPDRAVTQLVTELSAHQQAMSEAVHDAVEGVLEEFDPEALKERLLGNGTRLFGSARAWDAFARDYAEQKVGQEERVQGLLDRHFARAYARALLRGKRDTGGPRSG